MRIVNAMFGCRLGGLEQVFLDYGEALSRAGHEVHGLIHPRAAVRPALEARGAPFHAVANLNAWDAVAMLRLRRWLGRLAPDLTLAHGNRAVSLLKGAAARPLVGVAPNYQLKSAGLVAVLCSTADLQRHYRSRGLAEAQLWMVPNAVPVPTELPARAWHDPPVIGAMGRLVAKKGFDVWIEALRRLAADGVPFRALLAGDGAEEPALRRLAAAAGLGDRLECLGWVTDKPRFFTAIDLFCLPSLHEPFGVVLLEAMAQALPVVASDSEGPSEILEGGGGVLVPKGDPVALADAIARLLRDPDAARAAGQRARETVRLGYDMPQLGERLDRTLRAILDGTVSLPVAAADGGR